VVLVGMPRGMVCSWTAGTVLLDPLLVAGMLGSSYAGGTHKQCSTTCSVWRLVMKAPMYKLLRRVRDWRQGKSSQPRMTCSDKG
jgi:hypothetical protein